jgi:hypothetical protein
VRRAALVACALLLAASAAVRAAFAPREPGPPLDCPSVVSIEDAAGARLACADDEALRPCGAVRAGLRYRGCEAVGSAPGALLAARGLPIDVTLAGETDLRALPGVGAGLARRIVEARAAGPLCSVADLDRVPGLGPKRLEALEGRVTFSDPRCSR